MYNLLKKQGYHWIGKHSAVKKCKWTHESLVKNRSCYKEKFYGIKSHRCLQMSPAVLNCLTFCIHCWRVMPEDVGVNWNDVSHNQWEDPYEILEGALFEQKRILSGYKAQVLQGVIDEHKYREANNPNQIALSLSGEPLLYTKLEELISISKEREFSVFLVTSGVLPKKLNKLREENVEPTRLFISLTAPNEKLFRRINRPINASIWSALIRTIEGLKNFRCPTVIRITLIKDVNSNREDLMEFAELIKRSSCTNIEVKAYMNVGFSMKRLNDKNMPQFEEVKEFSEQIGDITGYKIRNEAPDSRVVLLSE